MLTAARIGNLLKGKLNLHKSSLRCLTTEAVPLTFPKPEESPVNCFNEWDPLEEVIVGRPDGAKYPKMRPEVKATLQPEWYEHMYEHENKPYPAETIEGAEKEVAHLVHILEQEGVKVRRGDLAVQWSEVEGYKTPDFTESGFTQACPRDSVIIFGNEIIESTMSWRSRYFESRPYKNLLIEYFKNGAKWTVAPKPTMSDRLYDENYPMEDIELRKDLNRKGKFILTEAEPVFDAADIIRCGKDAFIQISHVTNWSGYEWLKRHLEPNFNLHWFITDDPYSWHSDGTFLPLKPGLVLKHGDKSTTVQPFFEKAGWKIISAPPPKWDPSSRFYKTGWLQINVNILMLDEKRAIVPAGSQELVKLLEENGIKSIPVVFDHAMELFGMFHCWTVDVRRRGKMQSYF